MARLVGLIAVALLFSAAQVQAQVPGVGRLQPQTATRGVTPRTIQRAPSMPAVPPLTPAAKAAAVQTLMNLPAPANIAQSVHLAVNAPIGADGASMAFGKPESVWPLGNVAGFAAGFVIIETPKWPAGLQLYDCAVSGVNSLAYETTGPNPIGGQAPVTGAHLIFAVSVQTAQSLVLSNPSGQPWALQWCDISRVG